MTTAPPNSHTLYKIANENKTKYKIIPITLIPRVVHESLVYLEHHK